MLEQMNQVDEKDLGIGLQFSTQVGQGRSITFTAGFPLDWNNAKINHLVDKLSTVADRQAMRYELHDREAAIKNMYHQVEVQLAQRARYARELETSFIDRGKHGEFKPTNEQKSKLATYETSVQGLRDAIFKAEKELEELREQCR